MKKSIIITILIIFSTVNISLGKSPTLNRDMTKNIEQTGYEYYITFAYSRSEKLFDVPHGMVFFEVFNGSKPVEIQAVGFYPKDKNIMLLFEPRPGRIWNEAVKDCTINGTPYTCDNNFSHTKQSIRIKVGEEAYNKALNARFSYTKDYWNLIVKFLENLPEFYNKYLSLLDSSASYSQNTFHQFDDMNEIKKQLACITENDCKDLKIYNYTDSAFFYFLWDDNCVNFMDYILSSIEDEIDIHKPPETMWPYKYVRELIVNNQVPLDDSLVESWNALNEIGSTAWYDSDVKWCIRSKIDGNTIHGQGNNVVITFGNRNYGDYKVKKVSIAEIDPSDPEGNVVDSTWTKVTFDDQTEENWNDYEATVLSEREKSSNLIPFTLNNEKSYYVTYQLVGSPPSLRVSSNYTELYFYNDDNADIKDWSSTG